MEAPFKYSMSASCLPTSLASAVVSIIVDSVSAGRVSKPWAASVAAGITLAPLAGVASLAYFKASSSLWTASSEYSWALTASCLMKYTRVLSAA